MLTCLDGERARRWFRDSAQAKIERHYINVEPFHLERYVDEQVFRFNNRKYGDGKITDCERLAIAMSQVAGKRLTYAEVTGKAGSEAF